jgi:hypothetical protein
MLEIISLIFLQEIFRRGKSIIMSQTIFGKRRLMSSVISVII